jgi:hypothetical protein
MTLKEELGLFANGVGASIKSLLSTIGILNNLTTSDKTNIVGAINSINAKVGGGNVLESFTPQDGQTSFILSEVPRSNADVLMFINNIVYVAGADFIISGTTITWLQAFNIDQNDIISVRYNTLLQ